MARHHHSKSYRHHMNENYAGESMRRHQEMEDAGMIHEDRSAIANLPQNVMMKPYPSQMSYTPENLDDTIKGVDHQINVLDDGKRNLHLNPKKV